MRSFSIDHGKRRQRNFPLLPYLPFNILPGFRQGRRRSRRLLALDGCLRGCYFLQLFSQSGLTHICRFARIMSNLRFRLYRTRNNFGKQGFWGPRSQNLLGTAVPNPLKHAHFVSRLRFYLPLSLRVAVIFAEWDDSEHDGIGSVLVITLFPAPDHRTALIQRSPVW